METRLTMDNFDWPIIGHENITNFLQKGIAGGNLAHAYLFYGHKNVGKKTVARYFLNSILCSSREEHIPCLKCPNCLQIEKNIHPDVYWIKKELDAKKNKEKKNISIQQIRELQTKLNMGSFLNNYKISVIEEAQDLSKKAANALLKGLEEPKKKTILILTTTNIKSVIPTILSRCQIIRFFPVSGEKIYRHLLKEGTSDSRAQDFSSICGGRVGLAINFYKNDQSFDEYTQKANLFIKLNKSNISESFKIISEIISSKENLNLESSINIWISLLRDVLLIKNRLNDLVRNRLFFNELAFLEKKFSPDKLKKLIENLEQVKIDIGANVNQKLTLDNFILNLK